MGTPSAAPVRAGRKIMLILASALIAAVLAVVAGELMIRLIQPQRTLYPRTEFSSSYGFLPYPNTRMVHEVAGQWKHVYSTNEFGHRGPAVPISNIYPKPVIVLLGDSYTFGVGVDDGQEYAAILRERLAKRYEIANLGVEGWGLTQQIRRFYELGQLYQPRLVILQFCANDPADNLLNAVTAVEGGRFVFRPSASNLESLKRYLSRSLLQKSQIYNLVRQVAYTRVREHEIAAQMRGSAPAAGAVAPDVALHMQLLKAFAEDLDRRGIRLVMFAIDGQLTRFPAIEAQVMSMHRENLLRYVEIRDWFRDGVLEAGAEGHWTATVHRVVGDNLAAGIESGQLSPAPAGR